MFKNLKSNKSFQTIVGALTLWMAYCLYRDGWVDWFLGKEYQTDEQGFGNSALWLSVGSALLSFVQMVGVITIGIVSGILPHVPVFLNIVAEWIRELTAGLKNLVVNWKNSPKREDGRFNWKPFLAILISWFLWSAGHLNSLKDRVIDVLPVVIDGVVEDLPVGKSQAVIFLVTENITAKQNLVTLSGTLDHWMSQRKIERRRILSTQSMASSETWLKRAAEAAPENQDSLVVLKDGNAKVYPIPESISEVKRLLGE